MLKREREEAAQQIWSAVEYGPNGTARGGEIIRALQKAAMDRAFWICAKRWLAKGPVDSGSLEAQEINEHFEAALDEESGESQ